MQIAGDFEDFHRILHCHGYTFFSLDMCEIYALEIKRNILEICEFWIVYVRLKN